MKTVLLKFNHLAGLFHKVRYAVIAITVGALVLTVYCLLVDSSFTASALEPSIVTSLWGLLITAFVNLFRAIPEPVFPGDPFLRRLLARLKLFSYYLLAVAMVLVAFLLFWMSFRLMVI